MAPYFHHIGDLIDSNATLPQPTQHTKTFLPAALATQLSDLSLHGGIVTLQFRSHAATVVATRQYDTLLAAAKAYFSPDDVLSLTIRHQS